MIAEELEAGYQQAYQDFYSWSGIWKSATVKPDYRDQLRHLAYAVGWKKCETLWAKIVKAGHLPKMIPALEATLAGFGRYRNRYPQKAGPAPIFETKDKTSISAAS